MRRAAVVLVGLVLVLLGLVGPTAPGSAAPPAPRAGAAGIGDPYFPLDGNGGYDVKHYDLAVDYRPATDRLRGTARITAKATRALSRFNLDLQGLEVDRIRVDGRRATWSRKGQELRITPSRPLRAGQRFHVTVRYHGVPRLLDESVLGQAGVFPTADGAIIIGEPHVAATWFPVNDHPRDKATYRIKVTVPRGLEAVSNGRLVKKRHHGGSSTWTWVMAKPMASYLATATVGQFRLTRDRADGVRILNAIDPVLFAAPAPRTGHRFAGSGADDSAYKRLSRVLKVPARGGRMTFYVDRSTEPDFDYFFVEARRIGSSAWTTLPDLAGHTDPSTGASCPFWLDLHPFLRHYQSGDEEGGCVPKGTTGQWNAATGASQGYEKWSIDLGAYAGHSVEVSLSVVSDDAASYRGVYVDDIVVPGGRGSTSFEWDRNPFDGWRVSGAPAGSPGGTGDWRRASKALSPSTGERAAAALDRQPQILGFLRGVFGPYPFRDAGGIVDDDPDFGFALENQTRPIYSKVFFSGPVDDDSTSVVVHELAHQWTGNSLTVEAWQHIWLNEGFATYAEWLWSEHQGDATAQQIFDSLSGIPAEEDFFWGTVIGDPGPEQLFHPAVYYRGAMTLHALRLQVGDDRFFSLLKRWTASQRGGNVTTAEFQALAEQVSGQDLDTFFRTWLFTPAKPAGLEPATTSRAQAASPSGDSWQKLIQQQRR